MEFRILILSLHFTYLVMGLLIWGNRLGLLADNEGGCVSFVPHFGGLGAIQCPFDGSIPLSVDHLSQRVLGTGK